ncbi:MAG: hypothetical protein KDC00_10685 [Flavobacteriales bacterium]|nr:hypothetical protein [Flavobacteriales bacterium]
MSQEEERRLDAFLRDHPELDPQDAYLPTVSDGGSALGASDKEALKRHIPPAAPVSCLNVVDHLVARLEGDLEAAGEKALDAYLMGHPEHQRTARMVELTRIGKGDVVYTQKNGLHRHIPPIGSPSATNVEHFLVARLEGDLDARQEDELSEYLAVDPAAANAWHLLSLTRIPATRVLYRDKTSLKKVGRVLAFTPNTWVRLSAAATVLIVLTMGLWFLREPNLNGPVIAEVRDQRALAPVPQVGNGQAPDKQISSASVVPTAVETIGSKASDRSSGSERAYPSRTPRESGTSRTRPRDVVHVHELGERTPVSVEVMEIVGTVEDPSIAETTAQGSSAMTVPELIAYTLRDQVLEAPSKEPRPLDVDDAVAAVDLGLKAVSRDRAGLDVVRKASGGVRSFNLRLGRNLAISAQR